MIIIDTHSFSEQLMQRHRWLIIFTTLNLIYFSLTIGLIYNQLQKNDFMSLYFATKAHLADQTPYQQFELNINHHTIKLPYNLNPPIVFLIFTPLTLLPYFSSALLWLLTLMVMGVFSFYFSYRILFSYASWKQYWKPLTLLFLMFGASLSNENFLQLGTLLALLILGGYYLLTTGRHLYAGICWGFAAAIKFFPALLVFYLLSQKNWKATIALVTTTLVLFLLPLYFYHTNAYTDYLHVFEKVKWYGDNWNVSVYGYLFRIFSAYKLSHIQFVLFQFGFVIISIIIVIWYTKQLRYFAQKKKKSRSIFTYAIDHVTSKPLWLVLLL